MKTYVLYLTRYSPPSGPERGRRRYGAQKPLSQQHAILGVMPPGTRKIVTHDIDGVLMVFCVCSFPSRRLVVPLSLVSLVCFSPSSVRGLRTAYRQNTMPADEPAAPLVPVVTMSLKIDFLSALHVSCPPPLFTFFCPLGLSTFILCLVHLSFFFAWMRPIPFPGCRHTAPADGS